MASIINILCVILFVSLMSQGSLQQQCEIKDLKINQKPTGKNVNNKPEWTATISNNCICTQMNVQLSCKGFQTEEPVDPSLLSKSGDLCLINNGLPIYGFRSISFVYAWDAPFAFKTSYSEIACS
ncbi:hypothetical protein CDL12_02871 [Handroanthus impetiginosus]|uniref:Uncharacterized protein n=1 Tax=Handroanthus impetiginosus TaxID=429701 RepID=A0A2G9I3S0_9LAMI|nr:hypothetical protein CDL12_02871 [Handroanthus impetiginosus]